MRGPAKLATYLAVAMTAAGFLVIFLAWNGAASFDRMPQQFPYLLSGGMTGVGLIIGGMAVLGIQAARRLSAERAHQMATVTQAMAALTTAVRTHGPGSRPAVGPLPGRPATGDRAYEEAAGVVAGRTSFHTASCRMVSRRPDLDAMSRRDAVARGLAPCRVCNP